MYRETPTHRAGRVRVDWEGVPGQARDDDACAPRGALLVGLDDAVHERVANLVLDDNALDDGRGDKELVLDVNEVFAELNG